MVEIFTMINSSIKKIDKMVEQWAPIHLITWVRYEIVMNSIFKINEICFR